MKTHNLKTVIINHLSYNYFYIPIKNDGNGNPRFRVFIMDPDAAVVYVKIFKTYESLIPERVRAFIEEAAENEI